MKTRTTSHKTFASNNTLCLTNSKIVYCLVCLFLFCSLLFYSFIFYCSFWCDFWVFWFLTFCCCCLFSMVGFVFFPSFLSLCALSVFFSGRGGGGDWSVCFFKISCIQTPPPPPNFKNKYINLPPPPSFFFLLLSSFLFFRHGVQNYELPCIHNHIHLQ